MSIESSEGHAPEEIRAVPLRHPARWVMTAVLLLLASMLVHDMVTNPGFGWGAVGQYFFAGPVLSGVEKTIELTFMAMAIGIILGVLFAVMRLSPNPILSGAAWLYIWFFRGTPVYVQLLFWYNVSVLQPRIGLGIPFGHMFGSWSTNTIVTPLVAALLGLGLNEGAYYAEIVRAGIISVDHGQFEAAQSLGMRRPTLMRRIVLPQAMRVIVPPTGNETISMLKTSSLAVVVTYAELLFQTQNIQNRTFEIIPLYIMASFWYLFLTTLFTMGQFYVERYYARGSSYALPLTPMQRLRRNLTTLRRIPFTANPGGGQ
ncbi:MAG: amino acid ABC transporter permease [Acidimicrobiales bacterium]|jgi:polar amino acid transport system permease protein